MKKSTFYLFFALSIFFGIISCKKSDQVVDPAKNEIESKFSKSEYVALTTEWFNVNWGEKNARVIDTNFVKNNIVNCRPLWTFQQTFLYGRYTVAITPVDFPDHINFLHDVTFQNDLGKLNVNTDSSSISYLLNYVYGGQIEFSEVVTVVVDAETMNNNQVSLTTLDFTELPRWFSGTLLFHGPDGQLKKWVIITDGSIETFFTDDTVNGYVGDQSTMFIALASGCRKMVVFERICEFYGDVPVSCTPWSFSHSYTIGNCGGGGDNKPGGWTKPGTIKDSLVNDCLKNAKNQVTEDSLKGYLSELFLSSFSGLGSTNSLVFREATGSNAPSYANTTYNPLNRTFTITLNPTNLAGRSKEYVSAVILHEILHGFIGIQFPGLVNGQGGLTQHQMIIRSWIELSARHLRQAYPTMSQADAIALSIEGARNAIYEDPQMSPQDWNDFIFDCYGLTVNQTEAIGGDYFDKVKGTDCN